MNNEEIGRVGIACVIAALGALVEAQIELCSTVEDMTRNAIFWWILMIIGCGFTIDATKGSSKKVLIISSTITGTAFLGVATYMSVLDLSGNFCFSGISEGHPAYNSLIMFVWLVTVLGVFLLSFSNPIVKKVVSRAARDQTVLQIENIEKTTRATVGVLAALILILQII